MLPTELMLEWNAEGITKMGTIYILDVCEPGKGWMTPQVFDEDTQRPEMEAEIAKWQKMNCTVTTKCIHGMALLPLKRFLNSIEDEKLK